MKFDRVFVADGIAWSLLGLADEEGLLYQKGQPEIRRAKSRQRQMALSLLVLFDKLVVHDQTDTAPAIPRLESDGTIELFSAMEPSCTPTALSSRWHPTSSDPRKKPPLRLRRNLALVAEFKPLIINRLMTVSRDFDGFIARSLGVSRRSYYESFLDLALDYAGGRDDAVAKNLLSRKLPRKLLNEWKRELFDFQYRSDETIGPTNAILIVALLFATEIAIIREQSNARGMGVATAYYGGAKSKMDVSPSAAPETFALVRSALDQELRSFPRIESIAHAMKLRRDPHLRAFKLQLAEYHSQLDRGDAVSAQKVRQDVVRASRAVARTHKFNAVLRWLTYISLPLGLAETLLAAGGPAGLSLAAVSAAGTVATEHALARSRWVMFGS